MLFALALFTVCGFSLALFWSLALVALQFGAFFVAACAGLIAIALATAIVALTVTAVTTVWTAIRA